MSSLPNFTAQRAGASPPPRTPGRVTYFTHTLCPYATRVWICLLEKEIPFDLVHIDLSRKPAWYSKINPASLVPAIQFEGQVVTESLDIIHWLNAEFNNGTPNLDGSVDAARMKQAISAGTAVAAAGLDLLSGNGRYWGIGSNQSEQQIQSFDAKLSALFKSYDAKNGKFLLGDTISLADIAVYPFINRFAMILPGLCGVDVYSCAGGKVGRWLRLMDSQPSCQISSPDAKLFNEAARREASLDFFDYSTYDMFQLHPESNQRFLVD